MELETKKPEKKPGSLKQKRLIIAAVAIIAVIAAFLGMKHSQETNRHIESIVSDLYDRTSRSISYPAPEGDRLVTENLVWGEDGYFEQLKGSKKLASSIVEKMESACIYAEGEDAGGEKSFHTSGIGRVCRMAAILEYMGYENEEVQACVNSLAAQAAEAARTGDNRVTFLSVSKNYLQFRDIPYYGIGESMEETEITGAFMEQWQEVQREMRSGNADLGSFLADVSETAATAPVTIPEKGTVVKESGAANASASPASEYRETYLDVNQMAPYDEVLAALEECGEEAIFRQGEGGYYDGSRENGTLQGDFRSYYSSGRVRRTGQEDAFTEQYLRDHYDKPSKTYYYFKDKKIGSIPTFYTDTEKVFVYNGTVYAFTPYALYVGTSDVIVYDVYTAEVTGKNHLTLNEADMLTGDVSDTLRPYLRELSNFAPSFEYDLENNLVTVYLTALPGTTEALNAGEGVPYYRGEGTMSWENLCGMLTELCSAMYDDMGDNYSAMRGDMGETGVGMILASDVNPEEGLLSILNGEVVADNSANPPAPASPEEPEGDAPEGETPGVEG